MTRTDRTTIIDNLSNELNSIFDELMDLEEISYYRYTLLSQKVLLINKKIKSSINEFDDENKNIQGKIEKYDRLRNIINIVLLLLAFMMPYIAVPLSIIPLILAFKIDRMQKDTISIEEDRELDEKLKSVKVTIENIDTFVTSKYQKRMDQSREDNMTDRMDFDLANSILPFYLTSNIPILVPNRINNIVIRILQTDLQTDVSDLNELIDLARQKLNPETIEQDLCLERVKKGNKK